MFDCTHLGHFNAMRQSKEKSLHLTVGVDEDSFVTKLKASPVLNNSERCKLVKHIKWVDDVLADAP